MTMDPELRERLDRALDQAPMGAPTGAPTGAPAEAPARPVRVEGHGFHAEIDARQVEAIGVVVDRLRVVGAPVDLARSVEAVARELRPQGERLVPVEVAPDLGGAVLRTRPEDIRRGRFYQVELDPTGATLERFRRTPEGRQREPFALTRDELERVVEDLGQALAPSPEPER